MISATDPRQSEANLFRAFEVRRAKELMKAGMPPDRARDFARKETAGRRRASQAHGVEQALNAELQFIESPGETTVRFQLIYPPLN
jgi:hypothetical protein